jgi:predicted nuclease of predicted toxin-antitoxin system
MKVLLDTCVSQQAKAQLEAAGHDVVWVGEEQDPGDEAILKWAHSGERVLVTLDKDFGTLAVLHNQPHCGIIRLVGVNSTQQGLVCLQVLQNNAEDLLAGALITASKDRMRKRRGEL